MKQDIVTPVYTGKGSPDLVNNYRSISLTMIYLIIFNNTRLFVDDTSLFLVVDNDVNTAAFLLDIINTGDSTWVTDLNPNKTCNINFSRGSHNHPPV